MPTFRLSSRLVRPLLLSLSLAAAGCEEADKDEAAVTFVVPTDAERATYEAANAAKLTAAATLPLEDEAIYSFLEQILTDHPEVFGTTLAFDPAFATRPLAPYAYRGATGVLRKDLTLGGYDYSNQPWFTKPVQTMAAVWSEPYFDAGGGDINMVTYSAPVVKDGVIIGVLTADFGPLATAP